MTDLRKQEELPNEAVHRKADEPGEPCVGKHKK